MNEPLHLPRTTIKVMGLGGGGSNTIARMIEFGVQGVEFIAANTDAQVLRVNPAAVKVLLGPKTTGGQGAGGKPAVGRRAAEESREAIAAALAGADMVFLTAGMGGGTGTGAIAVAAEVARAQGAVVVSVVTTPFGFEGPHRQRNALQGLAALRQHTHTLVTVPNDRLLEIVTPDVSLEAAFHLADEVLRRAIQGITDIITQTGLINRDFNDIRRMMSHGGGALITMGHGKGEQRVREAILHALRNPLLGDIPLHTASGVLANFVSGEDIPLDELITGMEQLHGLLPQDADVVWGVSHEPRLGKRVELVLLVTGVGEGAEAEAGRETVSAARQRPAPASPPPAPAVQHPSPAVPAAAWQEVDIPAFLRRRMRSVAA